MRQLHKKANQELAAPIVLATTDISLPDLKDLVQAALTELNDQFDAWRAKTNGLKRWATSKVGDPSRFHYHYADSPEGVVWIGYAHSAVAQVRSQSTTNYSHDGRWLAQVDRHPPRDQSPEPSVTICLRKWTVTDGGKIANHDRYVAVTEILRERLVGKHQ
jgi:hypothetical protein